MKIEEVRHRILLVPGMDKREVLAQMRRAYLTGGVNLEPIGYDITGEWVGPWYTVQGP